MRGQIIGKPRVEGTEVVFDIDLAGRKIVLSSETLWSYAPARSDHVLDFGAAEDAANDYVQRFPHEVRELYEQAHRRRSEARLRTPGPESARLLRATVAEPPKVVGDRLEFRITVGRKTHVLESRDPWQYGAETIGGEALHAAKEAANEYARQHADELGALYERCLARRR